jgi:hypothetical protein
MFISVIRFILKGWVSAFYIKPVFHFTFYGFEWVRPLGATGMYLLFALLVATSLFITIGLFYRASIIVFFTGFTYVELIDKTTYLNHYYFISVMAFLLIWVPADRYLSVDVWRKPEKQITKVPAWCIDIFKLQLIMVYFFAGVSKLNYDWLIDAMPLRIWLPGQSSLPIIGPLLAQVWVAYVFSWFGAIFDLLIGFFLLNDRTRKVAYMFVVIFHLVTGWLFKIGMFPYIMILATLVFFRWEPKTSNERTYHPNKIILAVLALHFTMQLLIPLRYLLYPDKLYWTEEGYRFSWRVMLMEKGGTAFFHVQDPATGRTAEIINSKYLTHFQETQMSTQPDMILQYAHLLADEYRKQGIQHPIVTVQSYVTLNGSGSRLYIDSTVNLADEEDGWGRKKWILPFQQKQ